MTEIQEEQPEATAAHCRAFTVTLTPEATSDFARLPASAAAMLQLVLEHLLPDCAPKVFDAVPTEQADVRLFHLKYGIACSSEPAFLDPVMLADRVCHVYSEIGEFQLACANKDLLGAADALVDAVYVLHGTALKMGLPWGQVWREVQRANMGKVAVLSAEQSKRGNSVDVVKPEGWKGPDHAQFLGEGPWPTFRVTRIDSDLGTELSHGEAP